MKRQHEFNNIKIQLYKNAHHDQVGVYSRDTKMVHIHQSVNVIHQYQQNEG